MSGPVTSVARVEDVQIFLKDPVFVPVFSNIFFFFGDAYQFGPSEADDFTRLVNTTQAVRHEHQIAKECLETQNRGRIFDRYQSILANCSLNEAVNDIRRRRKCQRARM